MNYLTVNFQDESSALARIIIRHWLDINRYSEKLIELTGKTVVYGTLYNSLEYLIRKDYVESHRGEPTPERGGKAKSIYLITTAGREALLNTRHYRDRLWKGLSEAEIKSEKPAGS